MRGMARTNSLQPWRPAQMHAVPLPAGWPDATQAPAVGRTSVLSVHSRMEKRHQVQAGATEGAGQRAGRTSVLSVHRSMEKSVPLAWPCHTQMATPDDSTTSDATTLLVGTWPSMK